MKKTTLILFFLFSFQVLAFEDTYPKKMVCDGIEQHDAAIQLDNSEIGLLNANLATKAQQKMTKSQKIKAMEKAIKVWHSGAGGYTANEIAQAIVWASDCTGSNLRWLSGILANESNYCLHRKSLNPKAHDSGCGQFTKPAVNTIKLQMKLANRPKTGKYRGKVVKIDDARPAATKAIHAMVKSCYAKYRKEYKGVVDGSQGKGTYEQYIAVMGKGH